MKRVLFATAIAFSSIAGPVFAADVAVSVTIGHPDFFGRLELGNISPPPVIYARPVIIERAPRGVVVEPLYLRVPPGHAKNWKRFCSRYDACGRPVYFVKDDWYRNTYAPRYREEHREYRHEERREEYREDRREERREDRREERRDERREERRGEQKGNRHDDHHDDRRDDRDH